MFDLQKSKKDHEKSGHGVDLEWNILCHGVPRQGILAWARGQPHKIPLDMGVDILPILLMSCPTPCMVLSLALGNLGQWEQVLGKYI
jgi:hypothetical protein